MNYRISAALCAALIVTACGSAEQADDAAGADTAEVTQTPPAAEPSAASSPTAIAAVEPGSPPTREFLVGKWGEDGDCTFAIDFRADGTMDGPVDRWELEDGKLTMVGMPQKMHLTVIDDETLESRLDGTGKPTRLKHC